MKKLRGLCIIFVAAFLISGLIFGTANINNAKAAAKKVKAVKKTYIATVINSNINIYAAPKASSKVLGRAKEDVVLTVKKVSYSKNWHQVSYKGKNGFVKKADVTVTEKGKTTTGKTVGQSGTAVNAPVAPTPGGTGATPSAPVSPENTPAAPAVPDNTVYTIDNSLFGIDNTGKNARATTDGINKALQTAKAQGFQKVVFQGGTYLIQCLWCDRFSAPTDGILVPSGLTLDLGSSTFVMEPNNFPEYCIFGVVDQSNVTITGGTLIGDLDRHVFTPSAASPTHEWGFGICISASKNVTVKGVTIKNTTGDGIILEGSYDFLSNGGRLSSGIKVLNCDISNCRRQGISVIGAPDSEIAGNKIYNIKGTDPQFGIDVETELDYYVDNLKIHDNTIYGCSGGAIACSKGSNYEVYANTCIGNCIYSYKASNVKIYKNTINNSFIQVATTSSNISAKDNILKGESYITFD